MFDIRRLLPLEIGLRLGEWTAFDLTFLAPPAPDESFEPEFVSNRTTFGFVAGDDEVPDDVELNLEPFEEE